MAVKTVKTAGGMAAALKALIGERQCQQWRQWHRRLQEGRPWWQGGASVKAMKGAEGLTAAAVKGPAATTFSTAIVVQQHELCTDHTL